MRRHGYPRVVAEHCGGSLDVGALVRIHEPLKEGEFLRGWLGRRGIGAAMRLVGCMVARARCRALLTAVTGHVELHRRFGGREFEDVAKDQHGSLARRQQLNGGQVGELDRLSADSERIGLLFARRDLVEQPVGEGLDQGTSPSELSERAADRRLVRRIASRQTFVAMRYSHARKFVEPSKVARLRHARRNVSCTASSASSNEPSIR